MTTDFGAIFPPHFVRNTEKTCPKGGMMAQRNEAVAYETRNGNNKNKKK